MALLYSSGLQSRLQRLFDTCIITEDKYPEVDSFLKQIAKGKPRYEAVGGKKNVPWFITGILHCVTCNCDFKTHLINGDSLNGRTVNIPTGYPKKGRPPFTWEESAEDTLAYYRLDKWIDWSISGILYNLEVINGEGFMIDETQTSQVWCFSNHFTSAPTGTPPKCGSATLLRRMAEKRWIPVDTSYSERLDNIRKLGADIQYLPGRSLGKVIELQRLLNRNGAYLREDGKAGILTASAFYNITLTYLAGDPNRRD